MSPASPVTPALDGAAVARRFGLGRVRSFAGPVAAGETGEVWRLAAGGRDFAVKRSRSAWAVGLTEERAEVVVRFQQEAARRGVPTPSVHRTTDGAASARFDGLPVRVYGWVELDAPDPGIDPGRVGRLVASVHRAVLPADGPVEPWFTEPLGAARWDELVSGLARAGAPAAAGFAAYRDGLVDLERSYQPSRAVQLCHRDLWADNVLGTADGDLCVIDWDNAGPGDPDQELAFCVAEFARGDVRRARRLVAAYREAGGLGRITAPGDFTMPAAVLGHIAEMWVDRRLAPTALHPVELCDARLTEFLTDPLTPGVVAALVEAVADL
ncbi:Ser/Thr protein kinase RdoA (MazF antagonist) [Friedmanniella endophytica]|uniref:Ser/Thr protein kinase RdoA (MazF antagonist) n=1 Tax=Microlunatus kandeliicorticis TaxID=1759536 RepID=A0A7W3ITT0_9ACTN|nr:phosphotransferase [Microlunatus kandeliicorticis]MBA8795080.1 Ser/Thr protein kinase RdoA (MazF antagonist) [Microlunatus kandeliicorticis]